MGRDVSLGRVVAAWPTGVELADVRVSGEHSQTENSSAELRRVRVELLPWQSLGNWRPTVRVTLDAPRLRVVQQPGRFWFGFPKPNEALIPEHKRLGVPRKTGRGVKAPPRPPESALKLPDRGEPPSPGDVALESVVLRGALLECYVDGDATPRVFDRVDGTVSLTPDCRLLTIQADALALKRGARRRSRATVGGEVDFHGTLDLHTTEFRSTTIARNLHAPFLEYGLDVPFTIDSGTLDGALEIDLPEGEYFPVYRGTIKARDAGFTIDDAPSSFTGVDMDLVFAEDRMYLHNTTGKYGAIPLKASGDMDLNPVWGEYRISAQTTAGTKAMPFLRTMRARPPPYPLTAVLHGTVHVNGPMEFPVLSGAAHAEPNEIAGLAEDDAEQAVQETPGAVAAYDRVPFTAASTTYVYDTASEVLELHGIRLEPVGGGAVTGGGSIWVSPCAEQDPTATDVRLTGTDLPADDVLARYAPAAGQLNGARVGRLNADISIRGAAIAPGIDVAFETPEAKGALRGGSGRLSLNRQRVSLSATADQFDLNARIPVKYPPLSVLRQAWTREAAAAAARPEVVGCEMDARLRALDVMALTTGEEAPPHSAARFRVSGRARYSGEVDLVPRQADAAPGAEPLARMTGDLQLSGIKVNQLKMVDRLRGTFTVDTDGAAVVDARGRADEYLYARSVPAGGALPAGAPAPPTGALAVEALAGYSGACVSLRRGNMRCELRAGPSLAQATIKELPLDELELVSLRGVVQSAEVDLDFMRRKGTGSIELTQPRFSGVKGESFTSGFAWSGDVVTLQPTVLQQEVSRYELQGQYEVPTLERRAGAAAAAAAADANIEPTGAAAAAAAAAAATAPAVGEAARWKWELSVPVAEIAEALPAAQLLSQTTRGDFGFGAVGRTKAAFLDGVRGIGMAADELTQQLEIAAGLEARRLAKLKSEQESSMGAGSSGGGATGDAAGAGGSALPGLQDLRGRWQGFVEATGSKDGVEEAHHTAEFDLRGEGWQWGEYALQELAATGSFSSDTGLALQRLQIDADEASLRMSGRLLGPEQNAQFALVEFPAPLLLNLAKQSTSGAGGLVSDASRQYADERLDAAPAISGALYVQGKVTGTAERPEAEVSIKLLDGAIGETPLQKAEANAAVKKSRRLAFNALLSPATAPGHLRLAGSLPLPKGLGGTAAEGGANAEQSASADDTGAEQPRSEAIAVDCVVKDSGMLVVNALSQGEVQWISGNAEITVSLRGTMEEPVANGKIRLGRVTLDVPSVFPRPISSLACFAEVERNVLRVTGLEARCGRRGTLRVRGALPLTPLAAREAAEKLLAEERAANEAEGNSAEAISQALSALQTLEIGADSLDVRVRNGFTGQLDADLEIGGNAQAVEVGGSVRLSKGIAYLTGVTDRPEDGANVGGIGARAAQASGPSAMGAAFTSPVHMGEYDVPLPPPHLLAGAEGAHPEGLDGDENGAEAVSIPAGTPLLHGVAITLGPELRAVYPFVLNFGISGEISLEGYADPALLRPSGAIEFTSGEVNLVATQVRLNRDHANRAVLVPEHGLDPTLDVSLLGTDWQIDVKVRTLKTTHAPWSSCYKPWRPRTDLSRCKADPTPSSSSRAAPATGRTTWCSPPPAAAAWRAARARAIRWAARRRRASSRGS